MKPQMQDDFSAGSGNALQACVASVLELPMGDVPNFIAQPSYLDALNAFLAGFVNERCGSARIPRTSVVSARACTQAAPTAVRRVVRAVRRALNHPVH